jgi:pimeloyl-ACP methyl ester carboxylesterase
MRVIGGLRGGAVFVTISLVLGACGGSSDPPKATPKPADTALKEVGGCIRPEDATLLHHEGGGIAADVALFGKGDTTAVVTYEVHGTVCTWVPLAERLAAAGHQVLLFDQKIGEGAEQISEMVKLARKRGAQQIVLVGGSLGGEESIAAGSVVKPPVDAVVALSPASISGDEAAALDVPFLQVAAKGDTQFADSARTNEAAAKSSPDHRLLIVPGSEHASMMFTGPAGTRVLKTIVGFVDKVSD